MLFRLLVAGEVFADLDVGEAFRAFLQGDDRPQRRTDRPPSLIVVSVMSYFSCGSATRS